MEPLIPPTSEWAFKAKDQTDSRCSCWKEGGNVLSRKRLGRWRERIASIFKRLGILMQRADIVDPDWIKLLSEDKTDSDEGDEVEPYKKTSNPGSGNQEFNRLVQPDETDPKVGLEQSSHSVSERIFQNEDPGAGIEIAHIAARGEASLPENFNFCAGMAVAICQKSNSLWKKR